MSRYAWTIAFSCLAHLILLALFAGGSPRARAENRTVRVELTLADISLPAEDTTASAKPSPAAPEPKRPAPRRPSAVNSVRPAEPGEMLPADPGDPGPVPAPETANKQAEPATAAAEMPVAQAAAPSGESPSPGQAQSGSAGAAPPGEQAAAASGPDYRPPVLIHDVPPVYPAEARFQGWEGRVVLEFIVTAEGRVAQVKVAVSSGHNLLDQAAVAAALQWRYIPASLDGQAVEARLRRAIRFKLT